MGGPPPQIPQERANTMSGSVSGYMPRAPPIRPGQQPNGYPPPRPMDGPGYPNGPGQLHNPPQRRPIPPGQNMPQPVRPDRAPYNQPQRMDPRGPPIGAPYQRSFTQRPYPPGGPALNTDSYRTQSLASNPRPAYQPPGGGNGYGQAPANAFRQQPYQPQNHLARTTAQGRVVPERTGDERTMSMSSYSRDQDYTQTMSGRVIPNRRRESGDTMHSESTLTNGYHPERIPGAPHTEGKHQSNGSAGSRTMSMASTIISPGDHQSPRPAGAGAQRSNSQMTQGSTMVAQKRPSLVYGAMLSNVAQAFRERVAISEREKDGLVYQNAFTGYEAVELIAYIIRTSDRNLALLLGRSLDAQKYFHEVAYSHRLRDSPNEIYQFKETLTDEQPEVNGVFTLLTECYSPTCNRDNLCYSIASTLR